MTYYYYLGGLLYFVGHGKILHNNNIMIASGIHLFCSNGKDN
jgi:hypothetical protein